MLSGGSSAGKTTLGRKLQETLDGSWLLLGVDVLLWMLPPRLMRSAEGVAVKNGVISRGDEFMRIFSAFRDGVAAMAKGGVDLLIDEVMLEGATDQQMWNESLGGLDALWVGVRCDPDVAAAREAARGDRPPGIARRHATTVHDGVRYDLEVDTDALDLADMVDLVAGMIRQRWAVDVQPASSEPPARAVASAWTADSAPWES
ncbi:MAG: chloramphenicol phosphotransferase [Acidimicrobiaceae bacterium]